MAEVAICLECREEVMVEGGWFSPCCGSRYNVLSNDCVFIDDEWGNGLVRICGYCGRETWFSPLEIAVGGALKSRCGCSWFGLKHRGPSGCVSLLSESFTTDDFGREG